jgi:hypothetical protein
LSTIACASKRLRSSINWWVLMNNKILSCCSGWQKRLGFGRCL